MDYLNLISIATIGLSLIEAGGLMMWLLLGLSVLVFTCLIERTFHFHRAQIKHEGFIDGIKNTLGKQRRTEALALCDQAPGPVSAIVKAMLMACEKGGAALPQAHLQRRRGGQRVAELPRAAVSAARTLARSPRLHRRRSDADRGNRQGAYTESS